MAAWTAVPFPAVRCPRRGGGARQAGHTAAPRSFQRAGLLAGYDDPVGAAAGEAGTADGPRPERSLANAGERSESPACRTCRRGAS